MKSVKELSETMRKGPLRKGSYMAYCFVLVNLKKKKKKKIRPNKGLLAALVSKRVQKITWT